MTATAADLAAVIDKTTALLEGVRPDQRALPTPCPDFDVAALGDHLIGWLRMFAARAAGHEFQDDPRAYRSGDDPAAEFAAAGREAVAAFRAGAADRPLRLMADELPGSVVLGMMQMEYVGHGWDLATATGQPVPFTDEEAETALTTARGMLEPAYRGPDRFFGEEVAVSPDAPAMDRLVAFLGRSPARH